MKKISILFVSILLLNLFSGCQFNKSTEYDAVDLSYEHILELNHFKCYASYLDQETTIEEEEAKELYKIVFESRKGIEHSPSSSQNVPYIPNIAVMDVSFISATLIIPAVYSTLDAVADFVCLVKPQFEVGRSGVGKGGIVKDEKMREYAKNKVVDSAVACGFSLVGVIESPIKGGDGNTEFLAYFKKGADT